VPSAYEIEAMKGTMLQNIESRANDENHFCGCYPLKAHQD
jgi:hypothetical protein